MKLLLLMLQKLKQKPKISNTVFVKETCLYLGKIIRTHGIHGQLILASEIPLPKGKIEEPILVEIDGGLVPFFLDKKGFKPRDHQSYLIQLDHVKTKEAADCYLNCETYLLSLPEIEEDSFTSIPSSAFQNFTVYDANNVLLGKIDEVLNFSGNTLIRLFVKELEVLLPFTEDHLIEWDKKKRTLKLLIPEGLLDS